MRYRERHSCPAALSGSRANPVEHNTTGEVYTRLLPRKARDYERDRHLRCHSGQKPNIVSVQLGSDPGPRFVEPYMVAYNRAGHLALSAWFLGGNSESQERQSWREYLLSGISNVTILRQQFAPPRPGYNPSGGKAFHGIQCAV
jgi:hypothetical protein